MLSSLAGGFHWPLRSGRRNHEESLLPRKGTLLLSSILLVTYLTAFLAWLLLLFEIGRYGQQVPMARKADVAVVLGAKVIDQKVSPVLAERLNEGVALLDSGSVKYIMLTGGKADIWGIHEADAAEECIKALGVPPDKILKETVSRTTWQNMVEVRKVLHRERLKTCLIITDHDHLYRSMAMARTAGLKAYPWPATTSRYRSLRKRMTFRMKESRSMIAFWILGR